MLQHAANQDTLVNMIYPNMFECRTWLIFAQVPERNKRHINVVYGLVWVNCGYNLWDSYGFSETRFSCDSQYMGFVGEKYGTNSAQWEKHGGTPIKTRYARNSKLKFGKCQAKILYINSWPEIPEADNAQPEMLVFHLK